MRRRKTTTATNTHLLWGHGGCHSTLPVRSLYVRVRLLGVPQGWRGRARGGVCFSRVPNWARTSQVCRSSLQSLEHWKRTVEKGGARNEKVRGEVSVHAPPAGRSIAAQRTERPHRPWGRRPARTTTWSRYAPLSRLLRITARISLFVRARQPRDLTSPPTRRRRAGTQTHERDAQRRRELHARRRAEPDRGVRPSRVSNPPPSRRFHDARPSPCSKKRSSTKIRRRGLDVGSLELSSRASRVSCRLSDALALVSSLV